MGLTKLVIYVDQPVYYPGQILSGRLVVEVDKPTTIKGIHLKYSGEANVHWTETHRSHGQTHTTSYSNHENYLALQQLVFGNDAEDCELAEGGHVFLFNHQLPINLPSSFEGSEGRIRYFVKATVSRRWKFDCVARQPVTVVSVCDLNHIPLAVNQIEEEASKTFWGHSEPLFMTVNIPVRGFVSGQIMPVRVSLKNEAEVQVRTICVTLEQLVNFHASSKSKLVKKNVFKNEFPVPEGSGCKEVRLNLQIPALPPSYLQFCRIIDLNYQLKVTARVNSWYHRNLSIRTELIMGNVPLMSYQRPIPVHRLLGKWNDEENPSRSGAPGHQPPEHGFNLPPEMTYEGLPPPTYEQSIKMGKPEKLNLQDDPNGDCDDGAMEFLPLYPVYQFENSHA